jgi:hypothetical protein
MGCDLMSIVKYEKYDHAISRTPRSFLVFTNLLIALFGTLLMLGEIETGAVILSLPVLLAAIILWPISLFQAFRCDRRSNRRSISSFGTWFRRSIAIPYLFLAILLVRWNVPFRAAFIISKPAMDRLAQEVMASPPLTSFFISRRVGLFSAMYIEKLPNGVRFASGYGHPFDYNGFAFSLSPLPPESHGYNYIHYHDNWYLCWRG